MQRIPMPKPKLVPTYLYLIREEFGLYKIGIARDIGTRMSTLQTATPYTLTLCAHVRIKNALQAEKFIHSLLDRHHVRGEWFKLPNEQTFHDAIKQYKVLCAKPKRKVPE